MLIFIFCIYFLELKALSSRPISPILSQHLIFIFSLAIIITYFSGSGKPGSLTLNIFTYFLNPLYVIFAANHSHPLTPANTLLTLTEL